MFQKEFPNLLPQISNILDTINSQMLLIFKTNDLMRGIEYTLKTQMRMGAFRVMSKCCVNTIYKEKINKAESMLKKFKLSFVQCWQIFKINVFYTYLAVRHFIGI